MTLKVTGTVWSHVADAAAMTREQALVRDVRSVVTQFEDGAILFSEMVNKVLLITAEATDSAEYRESERLMREMLNS